MNINLIYTRMPVYDPPENRHKGLASAIIITEFDNDHDPNLNLQLHSGGYIIDLYKPFQIREKTKDDWENNYKDFHITQPPSLRQFGSSSAGPVLYSGEISPNGNINDYISIVKTRAPDLNIIFKQLNQNDKSTKSQFIEGRTPRQN